MKQNTLNEIENFFSSNKALLSQKSEIIKAVKIIVDCYGKGGKVLCCGNGGSSADCDHIVGELMKSFKLKRKLNDEFIIKAASLFHEDGLYIAENLEQGLPAISLTMQTALMTAFLNDCKPDLLYAQQVNGLGVKGDVLIGISTSGNAKNVRYAFQTAKIKGITTIGLTGSTGGSLKNLSDICIISPEKDVFKIQEQHLPIYHLICAAVESEIFCLN